MPRPRLLDLFCGAGGSAVGYHRAGFDVVGVDIRPQPRYPFEFIQGDALGVFSERTDDSQIGLIGETRDDEISDLVSAALVAVDGFDVQVDEDLTGHDAPSLGVAAYSVLPAFCVKDFDAIHASPPCQAHSALAVMWNAASHPNLIPPTRALLRATGLPYVIENVVGAPLDQPVCLCGASLGLGTVTHDIARHRLFETNWPLMVPPCAHGSRPVLGVYGDHARDRRRATSVENGQFRAAEGLAMAREAFEMPWANWRELSQAIPPAYTELIGHQLMQHVRARTA